MSTSDALTQRMQTLLVGDPVTIAHTHGVDHARVERVFRSVDGERRFSWRETGTNNPWVGTRPVDGENISWCRGHVAGTEARVLLAASALAD